MNKIDKIKQIKNMTKTVKKNGKFELSAHSPSSPLSRIEDLSNSSAFG